MGGSGSTTSNTVAEFKPPTYTTDKWKELLDRGYEISNIYGTDPRLVYGNSPNQPMVAQMSQLQNAAANGIYGLASQGNPLEAQSRGYLQQLLSGQQQNTQPDNPYLGAQSSYGGSSPQFEAMLAASNKDIADQFARGTAAQTDAAAAKSGAFGGSAYNEMVQNNAKTLNNSIANNTNQQRNAQYERSAGLEQQDLARNAQLGESGINRAWQGYENAAGRGLQGIGLVNQQGQQDLQRWLSVMGAGDLQRQVESENIGAAKDLFNRNVQQPLQGMDVLMSVLQAASGQGSRSTSQSYPGANPWMSGIGGITALAGLLGS